MSATYELNGQAYETPEQRREAAKRHPSWPAYIKWDKTVHCGIPDMDDSGDRHEFEAFVTGFQKANP